MPKSKKRKNKKQYYDKDKPPDPPDRDFDPPDVNPDRVHLNHPIDSNVGTDTISSPIHPIDTGSADVNTDSSPPHSGTNINSFDSKVLPFHG